MGNRYATDGYTFSVETATLTLPNRVRGALLAVLNETRGGILYRQNKPALNYVARNGPVLTLNPALLAGMQDGDQLIIVYDDALPAAGESDDGSAERLLLTRQVAGRLAKVPIGKASLLVDTVQGTSAIGISYSGAAMNDDGTFAQISMAVSPGAPNGLAVTTELYGRAVGVRYLRYANAAPLQVEVDGETFDVNDVRFQYNGRTLANFSVGRLIVDGLPDGRHTLSVSVAANPDGVTTNRATIFGWLADQAAAYTDPEPQQDTIQGTVAQTLTAFPNVLGVGFLRSVRSVAYRNPNPTTPANLTIARNSIVERVVPIPAGGTYDYGLARSTSYDGTVVTFGHSADIAGVTFNLYGGN